MLEKKPHSTLSWSVINTFNQGFLMLEIVLLGFYFLMITGLVILAISSLKAIKRSSEQSAKLETSISKINDKLDELRLQVGIMSARFPQTIHMMAPEQTEKLSYAGAKRGPKPKNKNPT